MEKKIKSQKEVEKKAKDKLDKLLKLKQNEYKKYLLKKKKKKKQNLIICMKKQEKK